MRYLRPVKSGHVPGVGFVRAGVITSVPDSVADELVASGEWHDTQAPAPGIALERVTEVPAPRATRAPTRSKSRKGR